MNLHWTTVIACVVPAAIVGGFQLFSNRHLTRILDTIERRLGIVPGDKKDKK
jgi:cytochrome b subunit of formate dehydrogenase